VLEVRGLGWRGVLEGVSFRVPAGSSVGVVGKNGSGKTTLLRCIGGFLSYCGSVRVNGVEVRELPVGKRVKLVNYLPQLLSRSGYYTVEEFLLLSVSNPFKVEEALDYFQIAGLSGRSLLSLSGGELVKVFLARLYALDPDVYLLDEPSAFLDVSVLPLLGRFVKELLGRGKVVLVVSHDLTFLSRVCTRFLGLKDGKQLFYGDRSTLKEQIPELYGGGFEVLEIDDSLFIKPNV
jgi:ABC-type cobalamin/Fe3+-siderophores transport system ATPase subunit